MQTKAKRCVLGSMNVQSVSAVSQLLSGGLQVLKATQKKVEEQRRSVAALQDHRVSVPLKNQGHVLWVLMIMSEELQLWSRPKEDEKTAVYLCPGPVLTLLLSIFSPPEAMIAGKTL